MHYKDRIAVGIDLPNSDILQSHSEFEFAKSLHRPAIQFLKTSLSPRFFTYYEKVRDEESKEKKMTPHAAFRQIDLKKRNYITGEEIAKLAPKLIERVVKKFIRPGHAAEREQSHRDEL